MLLSPHDAELFFRLHRSLMHFVNQRLGIVSDVAGADEFAFLPPEDRLEVRQALLDNMELIETFVDENPEKLASDELDIVLSWRQQVSGTFYAFRQLKNYMVFLSSSDPPIAYGVTALTDPFEDLIGRFLPQMTDTVLLPFKGRIVYDGLLSGYNISFGGGVKRMLNDSYRQAKEQLGVVTSLPVEPARKPVTTKTAPKTRKAAKKKTPGAGEVKRVLQTIVGMTDEFCRQHLNDEYAEVCRKLAEKLSRKRPSPLSRGRPKTWACGIIRTIGMVNFLDDRTTQPHMKLTAIDKALGVGESTGQSKSMEIRKMLKIRSRFDMNWTLPSRMDDNRLGWMLEVNGLLIDVRHAPREVQEIALEKGLIPYIPADREAGSTPHDDDHREISDSQLFQFKITLNDSKPVIWRRIQVRDGTLDELHEHIQTAMGWTNSHLHQFEIDGKRYGNPELLDDGFMDFECVDSTTTRISDVVPSDGSRFRFLYEYDFGDDWQHEVLFEGCPPAESDQQYPLCVEGEQACPPEDVGGIWGYAEFLQALADPRHEQHDELLDWSGPFDPAAFDAAEATRAMQDGLPAWW